MNLLMANKPLKGLLNLQQKQPTNWGTPLKKTNGVYTFDCSNIKINTQNQIFLVLKDFQYTGANDHIMASFNIEKWDEVSGGRQPVCLGSDATERLPFTPVKNGEGKVRIKYKIHYRLVFKQRNFG
ncbi:MAG: hypothetical protein IPN33_25735 [Saprospiraceae bacterium]|nr:hypothetical protein [Saprospiraceae bacterium]